MNTEPTADEIARAKRWAAMQVPPVTVDKNQNKCWYDFKSSNVPDWIPLPWWWESSEIFWRDLTVALRPIFASVSPVMFEEAAKVCEPSFVPRGNTIAGYPMDEVRQSAVNQAAHAIRGLSARASAGEMGEMGDRT